MENHLKFFFSNKQIENLKFQYFLKASLTSKHSEEKSDSFKFDISKVYINFFIFSFLNKRLETLLWCNPLIIFLLTILNFKCWHSRKSYIKFTDYKVVQYLWLHSLIQQPQPLKITHRIKIVNMKDLDQAETLRHLPAH